MKIYYCILSVFFLLLNCKPKGNTDFSKIYTYKQIADEKNQLYSISYLDKQYNKVQEIFFSNNVDSIRSIYQADYDSNRKLILEKKVWVSKKTNKSPSISIWKYYYNNNLLAKVMRTENIHDTTTYFSYYDSLNRIEFEKVFSTLSSMWEGIIKYNYLKNKLTKKFYYDFEKTRVFMRDSVFYLGDTCKIIFHFGNINTLSEINIQFLKDSKLQQVFMYSKNAFSNSFYPTNKTSYFYDNKDSLIQKIDFFYSHTDWCGYTSNEQKVSYKYEYK